MKRHHGDDGHEGDAGPVSLGTLGHDYPTRRFEAVNAIVCDYEPYLGTLTAPRGASPEAAVIAAAHRALARLYPDRAPDLDARRAASLAQIADGQAKTDGIAVGEAAALAMLAKRADDASNTEKLTDAMERHRCAVVRWASGDAFAQLPFRIRNSMSFLN